MSRVAIETFSTFGVGILCIALGIMTLAIFFNLLSWFSSRTAEPETVAIRGILTKSTWASVHMIGSETFERVRFVGFTNSESLKNHLPYELNGMVILEDAQQRRFMVRAKAIRMIVIQPDPAATDPA